jgi:hypothetical protein
MGGVAGDQFPYVIDGIFDGIRTDVVNKNQFNSVG